MRVGIMGGTLDPVHNGHLEIARVVLKVLQLDGMLLLPAGDPPHKRHLSDKQDRLEMARLAAQSHPDVRVSELEVHREGKTYTVDTLAELCMRHPDTQWVYVIGADTVQVLESWRHFDRIARMCSFAAVGRPGCETASARAHAEQLARRYGAQIRFVEAQGPDISSTQIRSFVAEGREIRGLVPDNVAEYIETKGLYLCGMSWKEVEDSLRSKLKPGRFRHTLGVAETAQEMAVRFGVNPQRAKLAGLLHDCAKWMDYPDMVELIRGANMDVDEAELNAEPVVHAPAGSVLAARDFGVKDPEILSAIRKHTLGGTGMTKLEKIIYVADFIEPNRKSFDGLEDVRALAKEDLSAAAKLCARLTSEHVISGGGIPHPLTMGMLNETI